MKLLITAFSFLLFVSLSGKGEELKYKRKVVFEEVAATSCKWCPRAIVGMERLKEKYPDSFIGIVVHTAKDPMMVDSYIWPLANKFIESYPVAVVNRKAGSVIDPYEEGEAYFLQEIAFESTNALAIAAEYESKDKTSLSVFLSTKFAFSATMANYKYAIVITENNVTGPSPGYDQVNTYSGGSVEMGGFELLSNPVPASQMQYQNVARGIFPDFEGSVSYLPSVFDADEVLTLNYSFDLPGNILNKENIEVIALLLDGATGEIVNASNTTVIDSNPSNKEEVISHIKPSVGISTNSNGIFVDINTLNNNREANIEIFTIDGTKISQKNIKTTGQHFFPVQNASSVYVLKILNGKDTIIKKIKL